MRVLTCNLRNGGAADGENTWPRRKDLCIETIRKHAPQILCTQETYEEQLGDLLAAMPGFEWFGAADSPGQRHPVVAILYDLQAFRRISAGTYWLSETPHISGSRSWDSACIRYAVWLRLEELACGKEFRVVDTHLDHVGQTAREHQARIINQDAAVYPADYPQLLAGDMNADAANRAIQLFREAGWEDTYQTVHGTDEPGFTYHAFEGPAHAAQEGRIDWVFGRGLLRATHAEVVRDSRDGRYPSDHYFVSADIEL